MKIIDMVYKFCPKIAAARELALELWKRQKSSFQYWKKQFYAAVDPTTPPSRGERAWSLQNCPQPLGAPHGCRLRLTAAPAGGRSKPAAEGNLANSMLVLRD